MTSLTTEPPTLRFNPFISASASPRRSYSCYNCNHSFYITPTATTSSAASPSSFRCPRCHHRHLIPHHTISPTPPTLPNHLPPPLNLHFASDSYGFIYRRSDDSDYNSDEDDYDSDNSILSFETPNFHPRTAALKSFVDSLPIKVFSPNTTQSCSICMDDFEIKLDPCVAVIELPCKHYFHKDCILEWLQRSNTCPLCRYKLPVDPCQEQGAGEVEYDTVLVVDLARSIREPVVLRGSVNVEEDLSSSDATSGSETSRVYLDTMRDEDGDVMMIDA